MSKKANNHPEGKKSYELSFLLKDPSSEKAILGLLSQYKASITNQSQVNALKLAYPIKKHTSAYFGYVNFEANPADVKTMSDTLRLNADVLRFLVVSALKPSKTTEKSELSRKPAKAEPQLSGQALTNEALEEKLEEILK